MSIAINACEIKFNYRKFKYTNVNNEFFRKLKILFCIVQFTTGKLNKELIIDARI